MDLTTLMAAAFMLISAIGFDTVLHPRDVVLEADKADKIGDVHVTGRMLIDILKGRVEAIFLTPSIVSKPVIRTIGKKGIGLSITDAFGLSRLADALQEQAGYTPDQIRLYVFSEKDTVKVLVNGYASQRASGFQQEVAQVKDESIVSLVERATSVAVAHIDPYMTALNLMRRHVKDRDFKRSLDVIAFAKSRLPGTTILAERSMLENLEGMIALFNDDTAEAQQQFQRAVDSDPANRVASLNLALTQVALNMHVPAEARLIELLKTNPTTDRVVLSTAQLTLAGAYLGLRQPERADDAMKQAVELNPDSPTVLSVSAEVKRVLGDTDAARDMMARAGSVQNKAEDYAEIAALYFTLGWRQGQPVLRSPWESITAAPDAVDPAAPAAPETAKKAEPAAAAKETK